MALVDKPHLISVQKTVVDHDGDGIEQTPELLAARSLYAQLSPMDPAVAFNSLGEVITRPYWCMFDLEDASKFANGAKVTFGERSFFVVDDVIRHEQGDDADHASCKLTEVVRG